MQQQVASVPLPNTETYMVAPMHTIDYAGLSTEPVKCSLMLPLNVVNREVLGEARARIRSQASRAHVCARIVARRRARLQLLVSGIKKFSPSHPPL